MKTLYADERQDLETIFDELEQYERHDSVRRVQPNFVDNGGLMQTKSYNVIITEENIQIKGVEHTNTRFLDLEEGEEDAFEYLTDQYNGSNTSSKNA
ncbi:MAG: hypothetical protein ACI977_000504 [Candidatus Nanohaloarchaea archaeon]|jgi:hypothetical protein